MKRLNGVAVLALFAVGCGLAQAADFSSWGRMMPITFSGYDKAGTLTNFPVLVSLGTNIAGFRYGDFASPTNGADLRFTAANMADELPYEVERWDTNGTSCVWVQVPLVENEDTRLYAFWGRAGQAVPAYATNGLMWSEGFAGVWHLGEASGANRDSSTNRNHAAVNNGVVQGAAGLVAGAVSLDGVNDYLAVTHNAGLALTNNFTAEVLVRRTAYGAFDGFISKAAAATNGWNLNFNDNGGVNKFAGFVGPNYAPGYMNFDGPPATNDFSWHHLALRIEAGRANVFFDGVQQSTSAVVSVAESGGRIVFGAFYASAAPSHLVTGYLDEIRLSRVARSTNWLWASWANQNTNGALLTLGPASNGIVDVQALPAAWVGARQATLSGKLVNDGGTNAEVVFCWGPADGGTGATGDWPFAQSAGTGWLADDAVALSVGGLEPDSAYVYRCFAENANGMSSWSDTQSFTTVTYPTIVNLGAVAHPRGARLTAQVTDTGRDTPSTWFGYWIDGQAETTTVAQGKQAGVFSASVSPLQPGVEYSFFAVASNDMGAVRSAVMTFTPLAPVTNSWTGNGQAWNDAARWSAGVPADGHDVVIGGNVLLTNSPAALASFTVNAGATNTFYGWGTILTAAVVTINGTVTHMTNTDTVGTPGAYPGNWTPDSRVAFACGDLLVAAGGMIDANLRGYPASYSSLGGYGPGGARSSNSGGGHGSRGGDYSSFGTQGGVSYGSETAPEDPGSSGAGNGTTNYSGAGGGAVKITATGVVTVNGVIRANGGPGILPNYRGAGSGGSVFITCGAFAGTNGSCTAAGGDVTAGTTGCGGGGGRIAVVVTDPARQASMPPVSVTYSVRGGVRDYAANIQAGWPGTVWMNAFYLEVAQGAGGTADVGSGWFPAGAVVTVTATPSADWSFIQWSGNGVPAGGWTSNPLLVTMDQARSIQANFSTNAAVTRTWQGKGNWFTAANWSPAGIPGPLDAVIIDSGTNKTAAFTNVLSDPTTVGSLTISNAVLVFTNWMACLTAGDVVVATGGVMTLPAAFRDTSLPHSFMPPMTNRIRVVCSNFAVLAFGRVEADSRGFAGCSPWYYGSGPGCPKNGISGASHGGLGSTPSCPSGAARYRAPGPVYDAPESPNAPGSGGDTASGTLSGGAGGGLVRIEASGAVLVNGTISANGGNGNPDYNFGGSGGGIFIQGRTFASTNGIVRANGGNGGYTAGNAGGGGRVALVYDPVQQAAAARPVAQVTVRAGTPSGNNVGNWYNFRNNAELGTIFVPDMQFLSETQSLYAAGRLVFGDGATDWTVNNLTLSNAWLAFPAGFQINVSNVLMVASGSDAVVKARLSLPNGQLTCGRLVVTNGAGLYVYAGVTNGTTVAEGARVSVREDLRIYSNAVVYPFCEQTNGGAVLFKVGSLAISAGGFISASGAGYFDNHGPGAGLYGGDSDYTNNGGGGYGGPGGRAAPAQAGGGVYGTAAGPVYAGSGGGGFSGRNGGGVVWVEAAERIRVDGVIQAQGTTAANGGGGAGGGIALSARWFEGAGFLRADGGNNLLASRPGGGGGRIMVTRLFDSFDHNRASATGGTAVTGGNYVGSDGTVEWLQMRGAGTLLIVR
jgi:hypothetical protein